jgi:hypothetical protein
VPLYEFECPRGHVNAEMVPFGRIRVRCVTRVNHYPCNRWASKILSPTPGIVKDPAVPRRVK